MSTKDSKLAKVGNWFVEKYSSTPYIQALAAFVVGAVATVPHITAIEAGIVGTTLVLIDNGFRDINQKRREILFDELAKGERFLSDELIGKEEFLQAFTLTYHAAIKSRQKEKIERFARILLTGIQSNKLGTPDLEEFINILDSLSDRELSLLKLLKDWEDKFPLEINAQNNKLQYQFSKYWENFEIEAENQLNIKSVELPSILTATTRTGLYNSSLGTIIGLKPGQGILTPRFSEFIKWVENESL